MIERVDLSTIEYTPALLRSVPADVARLYEIIPVRKTERHVVLALAPAKLLEALDDEMQSVRTELRFILKQEIDFVIADREQIREYVQRLYGRSDASSQVP